MLYYYIAYAILVIGFIVGCLWYPPLFKNYWGFIKPIYLKRKVWLLSFPTEKLKVLNANLHDIVIDKIKATNQTGDYQIWAERDFEYGTKKHHVYAICKNKPAAIRLIGADWELYKIED